MSLVSSSSSSSSGTTERLLTILNKIISWYEKWQKAHKDGISYCQTLDNVKRRAFEQWKKDKNASLYPGDLKSACDNLACIIPIFEDAVNALAFCEKQIMALSKLWCTQTSTTDNVVFKTWKMNDIQECVAFIHKMFQHECEIKMKVIENIAHASSKDEVVWHYAIWTYPTYVNAELDLKITSLKFEIS